MDSFANSAAKEFIKQNLLVKIVCYGVFTMKKMEKETITVDVDARIIGLATDVLSDLGCSLSAAINVFLYQVFYTQSIPFPIKLPVENELAKYDLCLKISEGLKDIEAGRTVPGDQVLENLRRRFNEEFAKKHLSDKSEG